MSKLKKALLVVMMFTMVIGTGITAKAYYATNCPYHPITIMQIIPGVTPNRCSCGEPCYRYKCPTCGFQATFCDMGHGQ